MAASTTNEFNTPFHKLINPLFSTPLRGWWLDWSSATEDREEKNFNLIIGSARIGV